MRRTISSSGTSRLSSAVIAPVALGEQAIERLGLRQRAREPVEQEAGRGVRLGDALAEHLDRDAVRHELAAARVALGLDAERRARP